MLELDFAFGVSSMSLGSTTWLFLGVISSSSWFALFMCFSYYTELLETFFLAYYSFLLASPND